MDLKRLGAVLAVSYERQLRDFASLLLTEKLGPRTLQTLALVAEVIHGRRAGSLIRRVSPSHLAERTGIRFRFLSRRTTSRLPFCAGLSMRRSSIAAKSSPASSAWIIWCETWKSDMQPRADFEQVLRHERAISPSLDGRTVFSGSHRKVLLRQAAFPVRRRSTPALGTPAFLKTAREAVRPSFRRLLGDMSFDGQILRRSAHRGSQSSVGSAGSRSGRSRLRREEADDCRESDPAGDWAHR